MKREIRDYLMDILNECSYLKERVSTYNCKTFLNNEDLKKAFVRSLEVIGEAARRIPNDIKEKYKEIPWKEIIGMRNKITHEYFGIDYEVVWNTAKEDIPPLKTQIEKILLEYKDE